MTPNQKAFLDLGVVIAPHYTLMTGVSRASNPSEISDGTEPITAFDPGLNFNWKWYFQAALKIRARSVIAMACHVDGFPMWASTVSAAHCVSATPWGIATGRDPFGEFCEYADRLFVMKGFYFAMADSYLYLQCGNTFNSTYINTKLAQLTEFLSGDYGTFGFCVIDGWGDSAFWGTGSSPDFTDIPLATVFDHIRTLQPDCLIAINDHDDGIGDWRLREGPIDGEGKAPLDKPTGIWTPIETTNKWYNPYDRPFEPLQPALYRAVSLQNRMMAQSKVMIHNLSPRMDGRLDDDQLAIVEKMSIATVPRLWDRAALRWNFDENGGENATESLQFGYDLIQHNGPGTASNTLAGRGRTLNGTTQYFSLACDTLSQLSIGPRSFSVAFRAQQAASAGYPTLFAKDNGFIVEWELFTSASNGLGGQGATPTLRISNDGATFQDLTSSGGDVVANEPFSGVITVDVVLKRASLQINGGTVDYMDLEGDLLEGVAESVSPFTVGALGNATRFWNGRVYGISLYLDRVMTETDGVEYHNGGKSLELFDTIPERDLDTLMRRVKAYDISSGTPAIGLNEGSFTATINATGSTYDSVELEAADSPGSYQAPSTAGHIRLVEVGGDVPELEGVYEIHFHNAQFGSYEKLWLFLASAGMRIDPLEVSVVNNLSRIGGVIQTPADVGSLVDDAFYRLMGNIIDRRTIGAAATQSSAANAKLNANFVQFVSANPGNKTIQNLTTPKNLVINAGID